MEYLLDTHTLLWSLMSVEKLSAKTKTIIEDTSNRIFVSTISLWEISIKVQIGKLEFTGLDIALLPDYLVNTGFLLLNLDAFTASTYHQLGLHDKHKDPFDKMLIWQAITKKLTVISKDEKFKFYKAQGLKLIW